MPEPHQIHQPPPPPPPPTDPNPVASTAANARRNPAPLPLPLPEIPVPPVQPKMIIKGMLGRYERWNPVHPTAGAFWGVGLGFGCGVGWGPGFGPEVIGYVGAGCGVGFSVGITLAGVGVGLPQHGIIKNHYHGGGFASNVPFESARFYLLTMLKGMVWDAISYASNVTAMRKESRQKLLRCQENPQVSGGVDLPKLGKGMSSSFRSTMECIKAFTNQNWPP
ncbi:hypothetical protein CFC21_016884 [Triticum aestivum]|uniref:Cadmium-induced protein AS8 n=2 Tax=Triticum aestivum TaxID=4565 RepID=A0A3B6AX24_WHEAT|nr:uncharacterized protein LOC119354627 [Triticum dicoccoides]XP_044456946.1 uncharacterized protein LOC123188769 [Triticum aestivum]KAF7001158.1 hypothetical protein CFC21_016884 [Triticum aestivum]